MVILEAKKKKGWITDLSKLKTTTTFTFVARSKVAIISAQVSRERKLVCPALSQSAYQVVCLQRQNYAASATQVSFLKNLVFSWVAVMSSTLTASDSCFSTNGALYASLLPSWIAPAASN